MLPGRFQRKGHRGDRRLGASSDDCEVKIGRVAVVAEVNKTERSPALEDQTSSVLGIRAMQLANDLSENVVPLHDRCVHSVCVSSPGNGVASEHD